MKILIVDNESAVRATLRLMLNHIAVGKYVIEEAVGVNDGLEVIEWFSPDVVLLDVEMDDGSGLDLLRQIPVPGFEVIFITAHDQYAVDAFRFSAVDFLLKPVDPDLLQIAVARVSQRVSNQDLLEQLAVLQSKLAKHETDNGKIVLRDLNGAHFIEVSDIFYCEAKGNYTRFVIDGRNPVLVSKNLKEYQSMLEPVGFIRCHHGFLVNTAMVRGFEKKDGGCLRMANGMFVPVSQRKKDWVLERLGKRM